MITFKEYVGVALTPANQIAKKHGGKVKTIMAKDEKGKKKKYFYVEGLNSKDKAELYRLTSQAMKAMPGSGKQKELIKKLNDIRVKNKMQPIEEGDGLWANIHKKRKSGKRMRKPGEKGAPTKQDFERARGESVEEGKGPPESFEAQFKRRVVKTTKPDHNEKVYKLQYLVELMLKHLFDLELNQLKYNQVFHNQIQLMPWLNPLSPVYELLCRRPLYLYIPVLQTLCHSS